MSSQRYFFWLQGLMDPLRPSQANVKLTASRRVSTVLLHLVGNVCSGFNLLHANSLHWVTALLA